MKVFNNNSNVRVAMFNFYQNALNTKVDIAALEDKVEIVAENYVYDGEEKKPQVEEIVDFEGKPLQLGVDYEISYENNVI